MNELLERIEVATGPDKDLDDTIYWVLEGRRAIKTTSSPYQSAPEFTASAKDSLELLERLFPKQNLNISKQDDRWFITFTGEAPYWPNLTPPIGGNTLPLAILAGILTLKKGKHLT